MSKTDIQLNEKQQNIVKDLDGQVLVVACPGSGKTTAMVARTKALIDSGVEERHILVITFTKQAATSMKSRYIASYGQTDVLFCTIHSACYRILLESRIVDRNCVFNAADQRAFMAEYIKNHSVQVDGDRKEFISKVFSDISYVKNAEIDPDTFDCQLFEDKNTFRSIFQSYEKHKRSIGLIDLDDMLLLTRDAFKNNPEILNYYKERWTHIMIDEFQDTNRVQAELFYMLAGDDGNLCVVGDDDQSIYGFRSADSSIMLNFPDKFPKCKTYYLDTNYRSMPKIIEHADHLIGYNKVRFEKKFLSGKNGEANISVDTYCSEEQEAATLMEDIQADVAKGEKFEEHAILYRTNRQNQMLVTQFITNDIPFYTTETVKDIHSEFIFMDIMAYYRLSEQTNQKYDLIRILNRPNRFLAKALFENCRLDETELLQKCKRAKKQKSAEGKVRQLMFDLDRLHGKKPLDFVNYMYFNMAYYESALDYAKYAGVTENGVKYMLEYFKKEAERFTTMDEWAKYAMDFAKKLEDAKKKREGICLSTFHSAKGLEWDSVYIIGCNEGVIPSEKAEKEEDIEEERRLFYVAMTRARKKLHFSYYHDPASKTLTESRFLTESGVMGNVTPDKEHAEKNTYFLVIAENSCGVYSKEQLSGAITLHGKGKQKKVECENMQQALELLCRAQFDV